MHFFKSTNFNFIGNRNKAFILSGILLLITIVSLIVNKGPNLSIDFVGGTVVQLKFKNSIREDQAKIRSIINDLGYGSPEVKTIGKPQDNELQIIVKAFGDKGESVGDKIKEALSTSYPDNPFELRREEKVGPKIGGELQQKAALAILLSLIAIVIYIGFRFHLPFGIAAIVALFHDVLITIGAFAFLDLFPNLHIELSLPVIAALLTIVGYSLNDTIVVFDRIRENMGGSVMKRSLEEKINTSINQCLSRTIITSLTTFAVVITVFIAFVNSGAVIKDFSLALLVGVVSGTYSSMYIASPILVLWNRKWPMK
ncbi:MAG: protein translocase subunit SecF [Chitinivibrionales bacterium]|nr:protein translocase subunit SecF [Chitinivibrionales bacterium]